MIWHETESHDGTGGLVGCGVKEFDERGNDTRLFENGSATLQATCKRYRFGSLVRGLRQPVTPFTDGCPWPHCPPPEWSWLLRQPDAG